MIKACKLSTVVIAILIAASAANGQDQQVNLVAGSIGLSLVLPADLKQFSEEQMAAARAQHIPAKFIFNDPKEDLILAINTFGSDADTRRLPKVADEIKAAAEKNGADSKSFSSALIKMNGKQWLRFAFTEGPPDHLVVNEYFVTDWVGQYVLLNFSTSPENYTRLRKDIERSAQSVQFEMIADVEESAPPIRKN